MEIQFYFNKGTARLGPRIHVDDIYVDGNDLSGLSTAVLRIVKSYLKMVWFLF